MKKKIKTLSDDQIIAILAKSNEWMGLVEETDYKISLSNLVKGKLSGQKAAPKLAAVDNQLEQILPKLVCVLLETFCDVNFKKALALFNSNSNCKVNYQTDELYEQFVKFIDKIMRHKWNGYKGYNVQIKQTGSDDLTAHIEVEVHGLDWEPIRRDETKEAVESYMQALSLFVSFVNPKNNNGMVYQIDST